ncbi:MAG: glycosyltransferase, partial [Planctomycetota bacterium]|nr:glycosyltransferase [Planctomycetota bacterium]
SQAIPHRTVAWSPQNPKNAAQSLQVHEPTRRGTIASRTFSLPLGLPEGSVQATNTTLHAADRQRLLNELAIPADAKLIGTVGRWKLDKRLEDQLWAMDQIRCVRDDTYLLVVGDGPAKAHYERYAQLYHSESRVRFLGWRDDVPRILSHLNLYCTTELTNRWEWSLAEAVAAGVPVVAADSTAHRRLVVQHSTGLLADSRRRSELARWMLKALETPTLAQQLRAAGPGRMRQLFPLAPAIQPYAELLARLGKS